ncbi:putative Vacuolar protein sorting-associated protein 33A [Blattamonas nauphoetae]|uniref:Vacuolar protein sorting-associated protein 33A n=1 Tax=Blattamonas nauphoetae TaxID=2049346 RepID=A0ABQ9Y1N7_9EUKA|nr:putative Vacuolar protein sorting-associated protein 33A [Blattamonas nauphoetae]
MSSESPSSQPKPGASPQSIIVSRVRQLSAKVLGEALEKIAGTILIVTENSVINALEITVGTPFLKERSVEGFGLIQMESPNTQAQNLVFLINPTLPNIHRVMSIAKHTTGKKFHILFIPNELPFCKQILKDNGMANTFSRQITNWHWIALDNDLLTLDMPFVFRYTAVDGDWSPLYFLSSGILDILSVTKPRTLTRILAKGDLSSFVADRILDGLTKSDKRTPTEEDNDLPQINNLILLDRSVDLVTPTATQLTYLGLIDETVGIETGCIQGDFGPEGKKIRFFLRPNDQILREIQDKSFNAVGRSLHQKALEIAEKEKSYKDQTDMNKLRTFVKELEDLTQQHQNLAIHTKLAERTRGIISERRFHEQLEVEQSLFEQTDSIGVGGTTGSSITNAGLGGEKVPNSSAAEYIEDKMGLGVSPWKALRLMSLYTQCCTIKQKVYDNLKAAFVQTYGFHHVHTLWNAELAGILRNPGKESGEAERDKGGVWNYAKTVKNLKAVVDDDDEINPRDFAYTYASYAPISVRLVQYAFSPQRGWGLPAVDDTLRLHTTGEKHTHRLTYNTSVITASSSINLSTLLDPSATTDSRHTTQSQSHQNTTFVSVSTDTPDTLTPLSTSSVTLVVFIGGITYAEIAALRQLQKILNTTIVIATTSIITGSRLCESMKETIRNRLSWNPQMGISKR